MTKFINPNNVTSDRHAVVNGAVVRLVTFRGKTQSIYAWAKELYPDIGVARRGLVWRLDNGWDVEKAFTTPGNPGRQKQKGKKQRSYVREVLKEILGAPESDPDTDLEVLERKRWLRGQKPTHDDERARFAHEFRETKGKAYARLLKEGRWGKFQRRKAEIKAQCMAEKMNPFPSRTAIYFAALCDFPPIDKEGNILPLRLPAISVEFSGHTLPEADE